MSDEHLTEFQAEKDRNRRSAAKDRARIIDERSPRGQLNKEREMRLLERKQLSALFQRVFYGDDAGKKVLEILKKKLNYQRSTFNKDPHLQYYNVAKQDVINEIMQILEERYDDE